jgi:hypothetical protein
MFFTTITVLAMFYILIFGYVYILDRILPSGHD